MTDCYETGPRKRFVGTSCIKPAGHDGPHKFIRNDHIRFQLTYPPDHPATEEERADLRALGGTSMHDILTFLGVDEEDNP